MKEPKVQVGILFEPQIEFILHGGYTHDGTPVNGKQTVTYDEGKVLWNGRLYDELLFEPADETADSFELLDVTIGINFHWERKEDQRFQGALKIIVEDGKLTGVNVINVEDYLTSVISSEMSATASLELLKAHAVISRSWLLAGLSPSPSPEGRGAAASGFHTSDKNHYHILKEKQKELKENPTEAENVAWEMLRANQLGYKFRRQHIIDNYIVDFVCLEKQLVVEIDGGYHHEPGQPEKDKEREAHLEVLGYRILRFSNEEIIAAPEKMQESIKSYLASHPLPAGEGAGEERLSWYERDAHIHFDVCADDHCQRYQGITRASTPIVRQAIAATRGQILSYDGKICDARFSKCCGGAFEEFQYCWENVRHPYLAKQLDRKGGSAVTGEPVVPCPDLTVEAEAERWIRTSPEAFCNTTDKRILSQVLNNYDQETTDFYRWRVEYTQDELSALILKRSGVDYGKILDLVPVARGTSGRLWKLKIVGTKLTRTIGKELEIRRTLSPSHLYSSAFVVDKEDVSPDGIPGRFVLVGAGWGHGVGLCQIGAAVMGEQGYPYDNILLHYYVGAKIEKLYE